MISKSYFWGFDPFWQGLKRRKLVTNDEAHLSPRLVLGVIGGGWFLKLHTTLQGGLLLGGLNVKQGDHKKKKFFTNSSVEALIPIKEEY